VRRIKPKTRFRIMTVFTFIFYYLSGAMGAFDKWLWMFIFLVIGSDLHYLSFKTLEENNLKIRM